MFDNGHWIDLARSMATIYSLIFHLLPNFPPQQTSKVPTIPPKLPRFQTSLNAIPTLRDFHWKEIMPPTPPEGPYVNHTFQHSLGKYRTVQQIVYEVL